jgi:hypothetical protein
MHLIRHRRLATATLAGSALLSLSLGTGLTAQAAGARGTVDTAGSPGPALTVRERPTSTAPVTGSRRDGARITIVCQSYGELVDGKLGVTRVWDRIGDGGYVSDAYVRTGSDGLVAPLCPGAVRPQDGSVAKRVRDTIAAAKAMTGRYPYSWGGGTATGPSTGICCSPSGIDDRDTVGFDCSGLMELAFSQGAGLRLSSTSRSQYADGPRVPLSRLEAGDMVFWSDSTRSASRIHHVALYAGDGHIVEATRVSGPDVRVRSFSTQEPGVMPYAVRPIR